MLNGLSSRDRSIAFESEDRPAIPHRADATRVQRISTHVRDDRDPPLASGETGRVIELVCPTG
jgi:hypothetical protein